MTILSLHLVNAGKVPGNVADWTENMSRLMGIKGSWELLDFILLDLYFLCSICYLCLCLIVSMSPRPSNHLSSALTPDILDTTLQAEKRDHQDEHHKYIGRTTNNILGNALEKHNKYIRRVWKKLLPGHLLGTPNSRGRHDDTASSTYSKKHIWSNIFEINKRMKHQS